MEKADPRKVYSTPDRRVGDPGYQRPLNLMPNLGDEIHVRLETVDGRVVAKVLKCHECPDWTHTPGFVLAFIPKDNRYCLARGVFDLEGRRATWYWIRSIPKEEAERE